MIKIILNTDEPDVEEQAQRKIICMIPTKIESYGYYRSWVMATFIRLSKPVNVAIMVTVSGIGIGLGITGA